MSLPGRPPANPLVDRDDQRLPLIPPPCALIVFGATGDLARRKILPAVYDLANRGLLPAQFCLIGVGRTAWRRDEFIRQAHTAVASGARTPFHQRVWEQLAASMDYVGGDIAAPATFTDLAERLAAADRDRGTAGNRVFYLALPPAAQGLAAAGWAGTEGLNGGGRTASGNLKVVLEKPFGRDLASALELERALALPPEAVFRIDHQLGQEAVRGLLALRFANQVFEPLWCGRFIDHVQITVAEVAGVGSRAGYYDSVGALRDVMQNHLLQLLAITAMDRPATLGADDLRAAKEAALEATRLPGPVEACAARGQYAAGWQGNVPAAGYLEEDGIPADSTTETYAALKLEVATERWRGTPFYLRTGQRLGRRVSQIALLLKPPAALDKLFPGAAPGPNALVARVHPDQGVTLRLAVKAPQTRLAVRGVTMDLAYSQALTEALPEAYEQLLLDILLGQDPLFPRWREVAAAWRLIDPVESHWAGRGSPPEPYQAGTWGPAGADALLARDGRQWRRP